MLLWSRDVKKKRHVFEAAWCFRVWLPMARNWAVFNQSTLCHSDFSEENNTMGWLRNVRIAPRTCFAYDQGIKLHGAVGKRSLDCGARGCRGLCISGGGAREGGCLHRWHLQDPVPSENPAKIDQRSRSTGHELTLFGLLLLQLVSRLLLQPISAELAQQQQFMLEANNTK